MVICNIIRRLVTLLILKAPKTIFLFKHSSQPADYLNYLYNNFFNFHAVSSFSDIFIVGGCMERDSAWYSHKKKSDDHILFMDFVVRKFPSKNI